MPSKDVCHLKWLKKLLFLNFWADSYELYYCNVFGLWLIRIIQTGYRNNIDWYGNFLFCGWESSVRWAVAYDYSQNIQTLIFTTVAWCKSIVGRLIRLSHLSLGMYRIYIAIFLDYSSAWALSNKMISNIINQLINESFIHLFIFIIWTINTKGMEIT